MRCMVWYCCFPQGSYIQPGMAHLGHFRPMKDGQDVLGETALTAAGAVQQGKTESKKHPSLPKEVGGQAL